MQSVTDILYGTVQCLAADDSKASRWTLSYSTNLFHGRSGSALFPILVQRSGPATCPAGPNHVCRSLQAFGLFFECFLYKTHLTFPISQFHWPLSHFLELAKDAPTVPARANAFCALSISALLPSSSQGVFFSRVLSATETRLPVVASSLPIARPHCDT